MSRANERYPDGFLAFLAFLCSKYKVDRSSILVEYNKDTPPRLRGNIPGYYDGLLSHRERNGRSEFLITVFAVASNPLLTLGHEFAHLVEDLATRTPRGTLAPPDEARERGFDRIAMRDLDEFRSKVSK